MRSVLVGAAVVVALAGTIVAVATAPQNGNITAEIPVHGALGDTLVARELTVKATGIRIAERLEATYGSDIGDTSTDGVWVIVDAEVTPALDVVVLDQSTLTISGVHYRASDILPNPSLDTLPYGPGIPMRGSLVFEIPKSALDDAGASNATVAFEFEIDPQLDSVPTVTVDLTAVSVEPTATIEASEVIDK